MTIDMMDEHERSEFVRGWLRQNLPIMLGGVGLGVAVLVGIQLWQNHQQGLREQAQLVYRQLEQANEKKDAKAAATLAGRLQGDFRGTPYAVFAQLDDARRFQEAGDLAKSSAILTEAARDSRLPELKDLANLRLARSKLAAGDAKGALSLADSIEGEGFKPLAAELRGDALVVLKREVDAAKAYDVALTLLDATSAQRTVVELKRNDLPVAVNSATAKPASSSFTPTGLPPQPGSLAPGAG